MLWISPAQMWGLCPGTGVGGRARRGRGVLSVCQMHNYVSGGEWEEQFNFSSSHISSRSYGVILMESPHILAPSYETILPLNPLCPTPRETPSFYLHIFAASDGIRAVKVCRSFVCGAAFPTSPWSAPRPTLIWSHGHQPLFRPSPEAKKLSF